MSLCGSDLWIPDITPVLITFLCAFGGTLNGIVLSDGTVFSTVSVGVTTATFEIGATTSTTPGTTTSGIVTSGITTTGCLVVASLSTFCASF